MYYNNMHHEFASIAVCIALLAIILSEQPYFARRDPAVLDHAVIQHVLGAPGITIVSARVVGISETAVWLKDTPVLGTGVAQTMRGRRMDIVLQQAGNVSTGLCTYTVSPSITARSGGVYLHDSVVGSMGAGYSQCTAYLAPLKTHTATCDSPVASFLLHPATARLSGATSTVISWRVDTSDATRYRIVYRSPWRTSLRITDMYGVPIVDDVLYHTIDIHSDKSIAPIDTQCNTSLCLAVRVDLYACFYECWCGTETTTTSTTSTPTSTSTTTTEPPTSTSTTTTSTTSTTTSLPLCAYAYTSISAVLVLRPALRPTVLDLNPAVASILSDAFVKCSQYVSGIGPVPSFHEPTGMWFIDTPCSVVKSTATLELVAGAIRNNATTFEPPDVCGEEELRVGQTTSTAFINGSVDMIAECDHKWHNSLFVCDKQGATFSLITQKMEWVHMKCISCYKCALNHNPFDAATIRTIALKISPFTYSVPVVYIRETSSDPVNATIAAVVFILHPHIINAGVYTPVQITSMHVGSYAVHDTQIQCDMSVECTWVVLVGAAVWQGLSAITVITEMSEPAFEQEAGYSDSYSMSGAAYTDLGIVKVTVCTQSGGVDLSYTVLQAMRVDVTNAGPCRATSPDPYKTVANVVKDDPARPDLCDRMALEYGHPCVDMRYL